MKITRRLLVPTLIFLAVVIAGLLFVQAWVESQRLTRDEEESLYNLASSFNSRLQADTNLAVALAIEVANNAEIQAAFAARDRDTLAALTLPSYQQLEARFDIPQYQFHLPPATSFLRLHQLDRFGDDLSGFRQTVIQANADQEIVSGLELGRGGLGLRGVVPVSYQGQHVGTVEFGSNLDQAVLQALKENFNADWQIFLRQDVADIAVEGFVSTIRGPIPQLLLQASTLEAPLFGAPDAYAQALTGESVYTRRLVEDGENFGLLSMPLRDFSGEVIGVVDILIDRSDVAQLQLTRSLILVVALFLSLAVIGLGLSRIMERTLRPVAELTAAAEAVAAGDWSRPVKVESEDELGSLANAFNKMIGQLQTLIDTLEQRIAARTHDLMTSAEVSQRLSTILDREQLIAEVVQQVGDAFNYYHVHIYLLDEATETLRMVGGTGQAGQMMQAAGHKLALGQGLVGQAAATKTAVLAPDVTQEPQWLPNPLLPETKAEMAVPILLGQRLLGVLDVQQNVTNGLSAESVALLQAIANQIAIALQNTNQLAEIEANSQRLDLVVSSTNDGIWDWDIANNNTYFSPRWKAILGYADDEIASDQAEFASRLHPDDRDRILQAMSDYLAGETSGYEHEFRMRHRDGSYRWILARASLVRDEAGNPLRIAGSHSDITARKEVEARIIEEQTLLRNIIDSSVDWISIKDRQHRFLLVNRAFADSFGLTPDEMLGKDDLEIGFPEAYVLGDPEQGIRGFWADDDEVITSGQTKYIAEELAVVKDESRVLNTIKLPLRNLEGEVTSILIFVRDITELKRAEANIRQEQVRTEAILESLNVPVIISRLTDGTAVYLNEPMAELVRESRESLIGQMTPDFYQNPADREGYISVLREKGQVMGYEVGLKRSDGEPFWGLLSGQVIEFQGERAIITSVIDVTARRRAQDALALRARELQTVARVGTAAATILEPAELLQQVVDLTKAQFDLYHAHIYLVNEAENGLILNTGAGEVGRQMVAEGRQIPFDQEQSLVARAARARRGVVANDVLAEPGFLPHPLLPDTRAEMAVPLVVGERVLGVLDVQAAKVGRFNEEEVSIFTTLATQIAVALQNARRYDEAQRALDELTRIQRVLVREGWQAFLLAQERPLQGFHFDQKAIRPITTKVETAVAQSEFTLPLSVRGQTVGQLGVRNPSGEPLSENQRQLLASLTNQVAEALERSRLSEQTQIALTETEARSQELTLLNEMAQTLTAQTSVDGVLEVIHDYTSRLVSSEEFYVAFYNAPKDEVEFAFAVVGDQKRRNYGRRQAGQGLTEHLLKLKRPLLIRENVDQYLAEVGVEAIGQAAESWMGVPLLYGDETLGVISLQSYSTPRAYTDQHLRLLTTIANQAAIAIENARLIEATTKRARQEQLLREVSARVSAAVDAESVLKTATREIGRALGLETFIYLKNQQAEGNGRSILETPPPGQPEPEAANGAPD